MDKYEYKLRAEEIRQLIALKEYAEAVQIADTIDWRRVKSVMMLCTVSDLYKINRRFEESKELLLLAYDRHPGGRTIVYSLCELSIKMGDIVQAIEYYKEYVQLAPRDTGRYILQYKLYEAQEVSLEERIAVLEEFKKRDYREKWGYELAYLYHRVGLATKCAEECDQLILWFGKGKYVIKAMELKMLHEPLTPEQELKYRELKMGKRPRTAPVQQEVLENELPIEIKKQDVSGAPTAELPGRDLDIQIKPINVGKYDTINLQKALAESMKELLDEEQRAAQAAQQEYPAENAMSQEEAYAPQNGYASEGAYPQEAAYAAEGAYPQEAAYPAEGAYPQEGAYAAEGAYPQEGAYAAEEVYFQETADPAEKEATQEETQVAEQAYPKQADAAEMPELETQPGVSGDTIVYEPARKREKTYQETLAEALGEALLEQEAAAAKENAAQEAADRPESGPELAQKESEEAKEQEEIEGPEKSKEIQEIEKNPGFEEFQGTKEAQKPDEEEYVPGAYTQEIIAPLLQDTDEMRPITPEMLAAAEEDIANTDTEKTEEEKQPQTIEKSEEIFFEDVTSEIPKVAVQMSVPGVPMPELDPEMARLLSQEYDGQISLVVPEQEQVEKQITGQLSIEDVLAEWERMKKENEEKRAEETKKRVLEQTGSLLTQFDVSSKNGMLEQLQADVEQEISGKNETAVSKTSPKANAEEDRLQRMLDAVSGKGVRPDAEAGELPEQMQQAEDIAEPKNTEDIANAKNTENIIDAGNIINKENEISPESPANVDIEAAAELSEEDSESEDEQAIVLGETAELPTHIELAMEAAIEAASHVQETGQIQEEAGNVEDDHEKPEKAMDREEANENQPRLRSLTDDEKDLYNSFIQTKREKSQIINAVDNMSLAPYTGNIIITGDAGVEKVELAKNLIKEMQLSDANFSGKVAKITGKALNKKNVEATLSKLNNGALIIEAAGGLKPETLKAMNKVLEKGQGGIMIIMEDTRKAMNNMLEGCDTILNNFTSRIDIEALNNDALVAYAKRYARELEYSIDEMGTLALYTKIADMQTSEHVVTAAEVREIIDDAIYSASRKNIRHLTDIITGRRYDDEDMIILKEQDFAL